MGLLTKNDGKSFKKDKGTGLCSKTRTTDPSPCPKISKSP